MRRLVIGTRASVLALAQAEQIRALMDATCPDTEVCIRKVTTAGDRNRTTPLSGMGGKGVFVKELERALLDGEVDCCVHSMKDVPSTIPDGLRIGAVPLRGDPRDALVTRTGFSFEGLAQGALVATGSLRRAVQMKALRDDLEVREVRGNLDTRLAKMQSGDYDAVLVSAAGMMRLGLGDRIDEVFSPDSMVPAAGQGALAVEIRDDDECADRVCRHIDSIDIHRDASLERLVMGRLGGDCGVPFGVYARKLKTSSDEGQSGEEQSGEGQYRMDAFLSSPDGRDALYAFRQGRPSQAKELADDLADELLSSGISIGDIPEGARGRS